MSSSLQTLWQDAIRQLKENPQVGQADLAFLRMSTPLTTYENTIVIATPNEYSKSVLENRLGSFLRKALSTNTSREVILAISVDPSLDQGETVSPNNEQEIAPAPQNFENTAEEKTLPAKAKKPFESRLNSKYTFESFVIGGSNRFAHAAAIAVAEAPAKAYNPLFVYGGSGLGKTHLLHAIGNYALNLYPHIKVRYVNSEEFTNDFINSVSEGKAHEFQRRYRNIDILMIDDIQFLQGKEQTIEEFFHTFNSLHNDNKQVVITSDVPPKKLEGFEERLRSRFEWGLLTDVQPPDLETRIAILRNKIRQEEVEAPSEVLSYIASRFTINIRELEGALLRVSAFASLTKQPLSLQLAEMVLKDIVSDPNDQEITPALIKAQTAGYFETTVNDLCSPSRSRSLTEARQIAMYLCRELTELSLPQIGKEFGGRDHTTVMHANKKITQMMKSKPQIFDHVNELTNQIRQAARHSK